MGWSIGYDNTWNRDIGYGVPATCDHLGCAAEIDRSDQFPMDLWKKMGELGLLGITVSEEYGGANMGYLAHIVAMEEISRASASVRPVCASSGSVNVHHGTAATTLPFPGKNMSRTARTPSYAAEWVKRYRPATSPHA